MRFNYLLLLSVILLSTASPEGDEGWRDAPMRSGKDHALFFAINDYATMTKLSNPIKNANDIANVLKTDYGFVTEVVENPSLDDIDAKLKAYAKKYASGAYDQKGQLLIYFSGHGMTYGSNGYFMPVDANEERPHRTGLEYDVLRTELNAIACKHLLVVIDACYSISFDPKWPARPDRVFGPPGSKEKDQVLLDHNTYRTRRYFTSDAEENQTPDKSTLAYQLVLGLRTYQSYTGYLTADELFSSYLRKAAPTPGSGKFGDNEPAARFLFFQNKTEVPPDTRADFAAWQKAKNLKTCAGYRNYLATFPNGDFASLALQEVAPCDEQDRMFSAWNRAKATNTCEAYQTFIDDYPNSDYVPAASTKKQSLDCNSDAPNGNTTNTSSPTLSQPEGEKAIIERINQLINGNGPTDELIVELKKASLQIPDNTSIYRSLGMAYDKKRNELKHTAGSAMDLALFDSAEKAFSKAIELSPDDYGVLYGLASLYYNQGAAYSQQMVDLGNDFSKAGIKKYDAKKVEMENMFSKSIPYFKRCEMLKPNDLNVLVALRELFARTDDFDLSNEFKHRRERVQMGETLTSYFKR